MFPFILDNTHTTLHTTTKTTEMSQNIAICNIDQFNDNVDRLNIGLMNQECPHCKALRFHSEKNQFAATMENLMDRIFPIYLLILLFYHYSQESLLSHAAL